MTHCNALKNANASQFHEWYNKFARKHLWGSVHTIKNALPNYSCRQNIDYEGLKEFNTQPLRPHFSVT